MTTFELYSVLSENLKRSHLALITSKRQNEAEKAKHIYAANVPAVTAAHVIICDISLLGGRHTFLQIADGMNLEKNINRIADSL